MNHFHEVNHYDPARLLPGQMIRMPDDHYEPARIVKNDFPLIENNVFPNNPSMHPTTVKFEVFDPSGRNSIIEENLKHVCSILDKKVRNSNFVVVSGSTGPRRYMDQVNELVLLVNNIALVNDDRFRLDSINYRSHADETAEFILRSLEAACNYRF